MVTSMAPVTATVRQTRSQKTASTSADKPPPSSILASHLAVSNGNSAALPQLDRESFAQLLDESLGCDENGKPNLSNDVKINYKLISVIVRAGIENAGRGNSDDPFHATGIDTNFVHKCLEVIDLALRKSPEVIYLPSDPAELGAGGEQFPLFIWLVPKLLSLLTFSNDSGGLSGEKVWEVLGGIAVLPSACPISPDSCCTLSTFFSGCIDDLLLRIEECGVQSLTTSTNYLSEYHDLFARSLQKLNISDTENRCRFRVGGVRESLMIVLGLLRLSSSARKERSHLQLVFARNQLSRSLNQFQRLWNLLLLAGSCGSRDGGAHFFLVLDFFIGLQGLLRQASTIKSVFSFKRKSQLLWANCAADCLDANVEESNPVALDTIRSVLDMTSNLTCGKPELGDAVVEIFLPIVQALRDNPSQWATLPEDLQERLNAVLAEKDTSTSKAFTSTQSQLSPEHDDSTNGHDQWPDEGRARKRLRLSSEHNDLVLPNLQQGLIRELNRLFGNEETSSLEGLSTTASLSFRKLTENDQCAVFGLLGQITCATRVQAIHSASHTPYVCTVCDLELSTRDNSTPTNTAQYDKVADIFIGIFPSVQRSSKARVAAMLSLRRLLLHSNVPDHLKLTQSTFGEWCMQSLRSSPRELRIAAASCLKAYIFTNPFVSFDVTHKNRVVALEFLQNLWARDEVPIQETTLLALTGIAEVAGDEELNIILIRLVEYLGHSNLYISGIVYAELQKLAQTLNFTPASLLRPFWRTISVTVIKNFQTRPIIAQQLCDLLGMKVEGLFMLMEEFVLPYLVFARKQEIISRMALAHGPSTSPFDLCTQKKNLGAILSYLLTQTFAEPEEMIMSLLLDVSTNFKEHDLAVWIKFEPYEIACQLLKSIADGGEGRGSRSYQALLLLAQLDQRRPGHSSSLRKTDIIGNFIEIHILGIITQFTLSLNVAQVRQPDVEKRRCLAAIGEVIKIGKSRVSVALPQICACLHSATEIKELCNKAFASWAVMMSVLREEDIVPLVDQTLAIIVRSWEMFETDTQQRAHDLVSELLKKHTSLIRDIFKTMPSLNSIPLMANFETEIVSLKRQMDYRHQIMAFTQRLQNENAAVVEQALRELNGHLAQNQDSLYRLIVREQPDPLIVELTRTLLDSSTKFGRNLEVTKLTAQCLGFIGCLDPSKVESVREKKSIVVLSNFAKADDTMDFIVFLLDQVLVRAFLSATNTRSQGFLAWAMQELLKLCEFDEVATPRSRSVDSSGYRRWLDLSEVVRNTLTPFLTSRYTVNPGVLLPQCSYPLFTSRPMSHAEWLRAIVLDLLQKGTGDNVKLIFYICSRIITGQDVSIPAFLLPFAALNLVIGGIENDKAGLVAEMLSVLKEPLVGNHQMKENIKLCSESIFEILDYMSSWIQMRKKQTQVVLARAERAIADPVLEQAHAQIRSVEAILDSIPPDLISRRAIDCKSYARALFHWEQYIRQVQDESNSDNLLERLQEIYTQIDEPDGIEGISAQLHVLSLGQQILEHRKAGRWTAAQSWYELQLNEKPEDEDLQVNLITCLRESGQYEVILNQFAGLMTSVAVLPYAMEASWMTFRWDKLKTYASQANAKIGDFNVGIGMALHTLQQGERGKFDALLAELWQNTAAGLTTTSVASFQACHDTLLKLHVLTEVHDISSARIEDRTAVISKLDQRLQILGVYVSEKQYLLGIRRAVMELSQVFNKLDVASAWLSTAKLARKSNLNKQAFDAILRASTLGDRSATIEQAKLMWKEGDHRKAIQSLEGSIDSGAFVSHNFIAEDGPVTLTTDQQQNQNSITAKAYLLLSKWLDTAGQTQSEDIIKTYRKATDYNRKWEKGWYYLGKHYNKILDSEKAQPIGKESQIYITGEASKVVIENYLRSLVTGSKYVFQTLPKILTLWLELVAGSDQPQDARRGNEKFHAHSMAQRKKVVEDTNAQVKKYMERLQPALLYTILSQVVARICHPNQAVYNILMSMVVKVVRAFPQQALWTLLAVFKSQSKDRATRGLDIISKVVEPQKKSGKEAGAAELRSMITQGQKFSDELLRVSEFTIEGKASKVSLARDLGFNHKIAPSRLVVPIQTGLLPTLPVSYEPAQMKSFRAFPKDAVTITAFLDEALVLSSLQKPRKLSIRGSDGQVYGVLAKPKDDMRKDQRLMEFNTMINRFFKRDVEASKRRLYIRTYAVVPLNEECGLIEWVDNLKTFRDILLKLYREKNITPNYVEIRKRLDEACTEFPANVGIFPEKVLPTFPPIFHEWFVETFPNPSAWFTARLRYTRSCAVMSIVGHVLGLGDRHGENILFEEDNGGTLHVDFNCLFDKGLTFEKPECVPFRLTQNMIDAFGAYSYNGPFRKCCEITLQLLRSNEDGLMTILETFLHDPTMDLIAGSRGSKRGKVAGVPDTPMGVLDGVRGKVRGMLEGESVPLGVGGYVEVMIKRAVDPANLSRMYIGWCAFF